jgi:hypothetical protein
MCAEICEICADISLEISAIRCEISAKDVKDGSSRNKKR